MSTLYRIDWGEWGVISGIVIFVVGAFFTWLNLRLGGQDKKIDDLREVTNDTRVSVARIEGYMAKRNGGGKDATQLPDLPPPVVVHPSGEVPKVVIEKS